MVDETKQIVVKINGQTIELPIPAVKRAAEITRAFIRGGDIQTKVARAGLFLSELRREKADEQSALLRSEATIALSAIETLEMGTRRYVVKTSAMMTELQGNFVEFFGTPFPDLI